MLVRYLGEITQPKSVRHVVLWKPLRIITVGRLLLNDQV